jgi:D-alanyl-D-alanine carboxypeptidase/D-alanyl-D-alanine-endopeptidase (penicillin-binding protein 4)
LIVALVLVVVAGVAGVAQYRYDALKDAGRRLGILAPARSGPAEVAPPEGLDVPVQPDARPVAAPLGGGDPAASRVAAALRPYFPKKALGRNVRLLVTDRTGRVLFEKGRGPVTPASTTKLLTSTAALDVMDPQTRFATTVRRMPGTHRIVLVGGGDPYLASRPPARGTSVYPQRATTAELAVRTAAALRGAGVRRVRLSYDDSLFSGPSVDPAWPSTYLPEDVVPPITALWVDEGKSTGRYADDPSREAADVFAGQLRKAGIEVVGEAVRRVAPDGARRIAQVRSAPLGEIVQHLISVSDNNAAEVVARHVGVAVDGRGSFAGATAGVRTTLARLGVDTTGLRLYDGSGLSRKDRIDPRTIVGVLRVAAGPGHGRLREVVTGLPIAGFSGSLAARYESAPEEGLGRVRAKTGTLTGVSALAGIAVDLDGDQLFFAVMADRIAPVKTLAARQALDRITAALAACHCRATP